MTETSGRHRTSFTAAEREYLASQRLGRLATVDAHGRPQRTRSGFFPQEDGTVLIGGRAMGRTRKWRNLRTRPKLALVVDDLVSVRLWQVRGVEMRGETELLTGAYVPGPHFSAEVVRIHPRWVHSWGLDT